jgi:threonine aldolase
MVFPGMVYISFPTEYGTLYSRSELEALHGVCKQYSLPLYIDGARMGYGLESDANDLDLKTLATLCDAFTIGGTKVGALCGEALVFPKGDTPGHFITTVKQHGALLAKGRLNAVQFDTLFTDGLYFRLGRHAIEMASRMKEIFNEKGIRFFIESPTNQQFVILPDEVLASLSGKVAVEIWEKYDSASTVVRFATSWATREEDVESLRNLL